MTYLSLMFTLNKRAQRKIVVTYCEGGTFLRTFGCIRNGKMHSEQKRVLSYIYWLLFLYIYDIFRSISHPVAILILSIIFCSDVAFIPEIKKCIFRFYAFKKERFVIIIS